MTYGELSKIKTLGFATNHVIDDVVNNARWAFGTKGFADKQVTPHEALMISEWAKREQVTPPVDVPVIAHMVRNAINKVQRCMCGHTRLQHRKDDGSTHPAICTECRCNEFVKRVA